MVVVFFSGYRPPFGLSWVNLRYMAEDLEIMKTAAGPARMGAYESAAEMGELTLFDALARHTHVFDYFQMAEAESAVLRDLDSGSAVVGSAQASHAQPVVVVGHSLGGGRRWRPRSRSCACR